MGVNPTVLKSGFLSLNLGQPDFDGGICLVSLWDDNGTTKYQIYPNVGASQNEGIRLVDGALVPIGSELYDIWVTICEDMVRQLYAGNNFVIDPNTFVKLDRNVSIYANIGDLPDVTENTIAVKVNPPTIASGFISLYPGEPDFNGGVCLVSLWDDNGTTKYQVCPNVGASQNEGIRLVDGALVPIGSELYDTWVTICENMVRQLYAGDNIVIDPNTFVKLDRNVSIYANIGDING